MDKHAETQAQSKGCPPSVVALYRLAFAQAGGEPPSAESQLLLQHLDACPVCRHTYQIALAAARREDVQEKQQPSGVLLEAIEKAYPGRAAQVPPGSLLDELAEAVRAPVLARFAEGSLRCLVGPRVLLLLLEPARPDPGWGMSCVVEFEGEPCCLRSSVRGDDVVYWEPGKEVRLRIRGTEKDELMLDGDGWGDEVRWLAVAFYPGDLEGAERLLEEFEKRLDEAPAALEPESSTWAETPETELALARDKSVSAPALLPGVGQPREKDVPVHDAGNGPTGDHIRVRVIQPLQLTEEGDLYAHVELPGWTGQSGQVVFRAGDLILGSAPIEGEHARFLRAAPGGLPAERLRGWTMRVVRGSAGGRQALGRSPRRVVLSGVAWQDRIGPGMPPARGEGLTQSISQSQCTAQVISEYATASCLAAPWRVAGTV